MDCPSEEYNKYLPKNYNFEIKKTLRLINSNGFTKVALQFPDGLLKYAPIICDIIEQHTSAKSIILGDVVYGGCCVDDQLSKILGCDILIHYGHSCIIPITYMELRVLYVFVDIIFDVSHCVEMIKMIIENENKPVLENRNKLNIENADATNQNIEHAITKKVALLGTIQFNRCINEIKKRIFEWNPNAISSRLPQIKPLSPGEVLGCTSPVVDDTVVYIADGRFHLESIMIQNPNVKFYKYCPFSKKMTLEEYDYNNLIQEREYEIEKAMKCQIFGVILSTLGRQGNPEIVKNVTEYLKKENKSVFLFHMNEISERSLDQFDFIEAWVQVSCPRLSTDWGANYRKPILNSSEIFNKGKYVMNYYSNENREKWKNNYFK
ncbi:2-(3-amino-3-carboxypropyl)histidine synthase subunit 1 [Astathelohania contejeani]|uniref:2-(3-amino-3-carboxypropyl)histidine synthase subunit 1 n=1 Tax=Astathelohania contejeani TaxID=164912 RepID=A0ABQ7HVG3_9MICR|nr:2-(3-amino-3-carboxypropyl)histidine synthase subunit 1 [Thelohania contejeani]